MSIMRKDSEDKLVLYNDLSRLSDNTYLRYEDNPNFQYIANRFYDDDYQKTKLLNPGSGLFTSVVQTISYFFDKPQTDVRVIDIDKAVNDYVTLGFSTLIVERDEEGVKIMSGNSKGYVREDGKDKVFKQYSRKNEDGKTEYYLYKKTYLPGLIKRDLYKLKFKDVFDQGYEKVSLDSIEETRDLEPEVDTGLDKPSIYIVGDPDGVSLLQKIENEVYSIDRRIAMLDSQFLQNVESLVLFTGINKQDAKVSDDNKLNLRNRQIFTDMPEANVEFINNTNSLIKDAIKYEQSQIKKISSMTNIPLRFLGIDEQDGSSGRNARMLSQSAFIKMLDTYKSLFRRNIQRILRDLGEDDRVAFRDTVLRDEYNLAEELKVARESRIVSQLEAIKKYQGLTTEEAELELERIDSESVEEDNNTIQLGPDSNTEKSNSSTERTDRRDQ